MHNVTSVELKRDCQAIQIPSGNAITLQAGTPVDITQTLGGSYTIHAPGGLFRIAPQDADALGVDSIAKIPGSEGTAETGRVSDEQVWEILRSCYDPEIPVNIVDLGLVYSMNVQTLENGGSAVEVKMTLTAPGCGMGGVIAGDAREKILNLPGVESANVEIVWEPQWHHSMITEQGRKVLGLE